MEDLDFLNFENEKNYDEFLTFLNNQAKEESVESKERHLSIVNTKKELIGLTMGQIRQISKQILKKDYQNFLKIADDSIYEVCMIKGIVIASLKNHAESIKYLDCWLKSIDSWSLCDSVVSTMKWLKKSENKQCYFEYFYNLCYQTDEYVARFGIVTLMTYYIEEKYIDKMFKMCLEVKEDKYYIQMAIAWLISFLYVKFPAETYHFLQRQELLKFTQNKAISKCRESFRVSANDKQKLNELKIK